MRGARAALVLRRAESLGQVSGVRPPLADLERDDFDGRLAFRLQSRLAEPEIESALRSIGDVEAVRFDSPPAPKVASEETAARSGSTFSAWTC